MNPMLVDTQRVFHAKQMLILRRPSLAMRAHQVPLANEEETHLLNRYKDTQRQQPHVWFGMFDCCAAITIVYAMHTRTHTHVWARETGKDAWACKKKTKARLKSALERHLLLSVLLFVSNSCEKEINLDSLCKRRQQEDFVEKMNTLFLLFK